MNKTQQSSSDEVNHEDALIGKSMESLETTCMPRVIDLIKLKAMLIERTAELRFRVVEAEKRAEIAEYERNAAVIDLETLMKESNSQASCLLCSRFQKLDGECGKIHNRCNPKWRGPKEE